MGFYTIGEEWEKIKLIFIIIITIILWIGIIVYRYKRIKRHEKEKYEEDIVGVLYPNQDQERYFFQYVEASLFIYNWVLRKQRKRYERSEECLNPRVLCSRLNQLLQCPDPDLFERIKKYKRIQSVPEGIRYLEISEACEDCLVAFEHRGRFPDYRSCGQSDLYFNLSGSFIEYARDFVFIEGITPPWQKGGTNPRTIRLDRKGEILDSHEKSRIRVERIGRDWCIKINETN